MFYLVIFAFILIGSFCQIYATSKSEKYFSNIYFLAIIFLLIVIGGFRYETGGDWPGYKNIYDSVDTRAIEPLFIGIVYLSKGMGSYQWMFFFCEIIRFFTMMIFLQKNTFYDKKYKILFILLYYVMYWFYYDLVIVRQSTAAAVYTFGLLTNKKMSYKKYLIYVLLAIGFHFSSIVLIVMYPFIFKATKKQMAILSLIIIIFYLIGLDFFSTLLVLILEFLPKTYLIYRLYAYTQITTLATSRSLTGQTLVYLLVYFAMLYKEFKLRKTEEPLFFNGVCIFMLIFFGFPSFSTICTRLAANFSIFVIFIILSLIKCFRKTVIIPIALVTLCFCFNKGVFFELPDKIAYNPYQFYWTHQIFNLPSDGLERLNSTPDYSKGK